MSTQPKQKNRNMRRKEKTKYALVLSGGGFKGAFQLGALNYLNENWQVITGLKSKMKFDLIAGVSVGAINGAMLAMGEMEALNNLWLEKIRKNGASEIYTSDFIDTSNKGNELKMKLDLVAILKRLIPDLRLNLNLKDKLTGLFSKKKREQILIELLHQVTAQLKSGVTNFKAIADNSPLKEKLIAYLDRTKIKDTTFLCGFVSLDNGKYQSVAHNSFATNRDFVNGVLASAAIPMVWPPIQQIDYLTAQNTFNRSYNLIDGGVNNVSPLGDVVRYINQDVGYDYKIIIINCHSGVNSYMDFSNKHIGQIAGRTLYDIAFTEIFNNDVKHFLKINDLVKQAKEWNEDIVLFDSGVKQIKSFDVAIINPDHTIDLGNGLATNEEFISRRLHHGEEMAKKRFKEGGKIWS